MNTEIDNTAAAFLEAPSTTSKLLLQERAARVGQSLFGLVKFLMVTAPFLSMAVMILALWGVVGKATYPDLDKAATQAAAPASDAGKAPEAKNYLVNETKPIEQCPEAVQTLDTGSDEEAPTSGKIDWEHVV